MLIFLPYVVPFVAGVLIWQNTLSPDTGWLNEALRALGWQNPPDWLDDPTWIYPGLVLVGLWGIGGAVIVNLAGLTNVPTELYDAAKIDGAGWWGQLRNVTLPMMSPVIFYSLMLGLVEVMQYFLVPFVLKNGTGEPGGSHVLLQPVHLQELLHLPAHVVRRDAGLAAVRGHARPHGRPLRVGAEVGLLRGRTLNGKYGARPPARKSQRRRTAIASARAPRMRNASRSFLLTLVATCAVAAFLAPLLQSASMSLKTREQMTELSAPLWPADPADVRLQRPRDTTSTRFRSTGRRASSRSFSPAGRSASSSIR